MLEARIKRKVLKEALGTIVPIVDEARLQVMEDGLHLKAVDPVNIVLCDFNLQGDAFIQYAIDEPKTVGMVFARLLDIISVGSEEEIEIKMDSIDKLKIKNGSLSYVLSLPDVDTLRKEARIPDLEFAAKVEVGAEDLKRGIRASSELDNEIVFGVEEDNFYIESDNEMDKVRMQLAKEQLVSLVVNEQPVRSSFSTDYLSDIAKGFGTVEYVKIGLGKDHPLSLAFEIADGLGKVGYLVAPRV